MSELGHSRMEGQAQAPSTSRSTNPQGAQRSSRRAQEPGTGPAPVQDRLPGAAPASAWTMYRAMVGIGVACSLLIVIAYELSGPRIARNQAAALERAIFDVLPAVTMSTAFALDADGHFVAVDDAAAPSSGDERVYAAYDAAGRLVGVAIPGRGMGYQDVIRVLYGYSPAEQAIVGLRVLDSKETPGLGDRIETDADFRANFTHLDVTLTADLSGLTNRIVRVAHGEKQHPWEVDGITGATISSRAIANILDQSAAHWLPLIRKNVGDFVPEGEP